jgi:uncharacterized lipoprotein
MRSVWLPRLVVVLVLVSLSGCGLFHRRGHESNTCNDPQHYANAQSIPPLKTPVGLSAPDTRAALKIPDLNEPPPPPRTRKDPCLDTPPPYVVPKVVKPPQA